MSMLSEITGLSHKFGTDAYVKGGGGNTSVKNEKTLWIKPSGTCLKDLEESSFVAMDREKMSKLYDITAPSESSKREEIVKDIMAQSVLPESTGRASVEAPLHNSLNARFVVHTHPAIVNGMVCAVEGEKYCRELFPDALWIDYIDPGYTLCMKAREYIENYKKQNGNEPSMIFLKNHGLFISSDQPESIIELYNMVFDKLTDLYKSKSIPVNLEVEPLDKEKDKNYRKEILEISKKYSFDYCCGSGYFDLVNGPVTPDHMVYSKAYYLKEKPSDSAVDKFLDKYGYFPQVISFDNAVWGVGQTENKAKLAVELAKDASLVKQLTEAFGGINYMSDAAREFIENWEVESYRSKQV